MTQSQKTQSLMHCAHALARAPHPRHFGIRRKGAALTEFGLLVGLIAIIAIAAVSRLGNEISDMFDYVAGGIEDPDNLIPPDYAAYSIVNGAAGAGMTGWDGTFQIQSGSPYEPSETYFYGGDGQATATASQTIFLKKNTWEDVDAGLITAALEWRQGSYNGNDRGAMSVEALADSGSAIQTVAAPEGPGPAGSWAYRSLRLDLPAGTRAVRVTMTATRIDGADNDAFLDDIDLTLLPAADYPAPAPIPVANADAATGTTGWTTLNGFSTRTGSPYASGDAYFFGGASTPYAEASQTIVLSSALRDAANRGKLDLSLTWAQGSYSNDDQGGMVLSYFDGAGTLLDQDNSSVIATPSAIWTNRSLSARAPRGTERVQLSMRAIRISGTSNDAYFDNIELTASPKP